MAKKTFDIILVFLLALTLLCGCRRKEVIPDDTLVDIFHDAFLTNAYISEKRTETDSLDVYRTIFEKYGYSEQDLKYTIGNFSRRKSAQLGKILERVSTRLKEEADTYRSQVVILDTIKYTALRAARRVIADDSLIVVKSLKDSANVVRTFDIPSKGELNVRYEYTFDEDPINDPRRLTIYLIDSRGRRRSSYSVRLRREDSVDRRIEADTSSRRLRIEFEAIEDYSRKRVKNTLRIKNLHVTFTPTEEVAVDSLYHALADIFLLADEPAEKKDSI